MMNKQGKQVMNNLVDAICIIAKANVACATALIGYQPEVPQMLLEKEKNLEKTTEKY